MPKAILDYSVLPIVNKFDSHLAEIVFSDIARISSAQLSVNLRSYEMEREYLLHSPEVKLQQLCCIWSKR